MQITKQDLRKFYKQKRKEIVDKTVKDEQININLINFKAFQNAKTVFCYVSLKDEVSTDLIIKSALFYGKQVAVPCCKDDKGNMEFYLINSLSDLKIGSFGIREPDIDKCIMLNDFDNSVCIVPAVCFDKHGNRLGYGKGYYDRFLNLFTSCSIGLCYNDFVLDEIPVDDFDKQVDYIITEKGIINILAGGKNG